MKNCPKCKTKKPTSEFNKSSALKSGLRTYCKQCCAELNRAYEKQPSRYAKKQAWSKAYREKDPDRYWEHGLKRKYGIDRHEFYRILDEQGGLCAMCRKPEAVTFRGKPKRLCVDHDHATGAIRGLLCVVCNVCARPDDIAFLEMRIAYLKRHQRRPDVAVAISTSAWIRN